MATLYEHPGIVVDIKPAPKDDPDANEDEFVFYILSQNVCKRCNKEIGSFKLTGPTTGWR